MYRRYRGKKFAKRLFSIVLLSKNSQMPSKKKISATLKSQKTDRQLKDEIQKIISVTEEQNLAISKLLKNEINKQLEQTEEA